MKEDTKVYVKEFAKELANLVKSSMNEACEAYEEFVESSLKEKERITSYGSNYERFLTTIPQQIESVAALLKTRRLKVFTEGNIYVEFDIRWDTEFNEIELSNIELSMPPLLSSLLQTDNYDLVDEVLLRNYLEKMKYVPYCTLLNRMHCFIEEGKINQDAYPEFDWQEMVLNKAEDAIVEGKL